ncbi:hypothetical protein ACFC0M_18520 [Streptomyces sp. NPDC056149]|uniref:hypothetical protein n=1 Tax=Streptomyces sp. NPDC056149 TaxID=3345728 RepID=UPI0035DD0855
MDAMQQHLLDSYRAAQRGEAAPPAPDAAAVRTAREIRLWRRFQAVVTDPAERWWGRNGRLVRRVTALVARPSHPLNARGPAPTWPDPVPTSPAPVPDSRGLVPNSPDLVPRPPVTRARTAQEADAEQAAARAGTAREPAGQRPAVQQPGTLGRTTGEPGTREPAAREQAVRGRCG